jgi:hypothetical protein
MFHVVGGMGDRSGNKNLALGKFDVHPDLLLMGVTGIGCLSGIGPGFYRQD